MAAILKPDFSQGTTAAPSLSLVPKPARWWFSVLRFVDVDDLAQEGRGAAVFFLDLLIHRPTEFAALVNLFEPAYRAWTATGGLTARQEQAARLAAEAKARNVLETRYVSEQMDIGMRAAQRLLERGRERAKVFAFPEIPYISSRHESHIAPSEIDIQRKMAAYRCDCPGKGWNTVCEGHARGDKPLCWGCFNLYGFEGEQPNWLVYMIEQNRKDARQWAIDSLTVTQIADFEEIDAQLAA